MHRHTIAENVHEVILQTLINITFQLGLQKYLFS